MSLFMSAGREKISELYSITVGERSVLYWRSLILP